MEPCKLLWRRHWWQAREMFSEILDCRRLPTLRTDFVPTSPLELCTSIRGVLRKRGVFKLMNSIVNAANPFCVSRSLSAFTLYRWFFFSRIYDISIGQKGLYRLATIWVLKEKHFETFLEEQINLPAGKTKGEEKSAKEYLWGLTFTISQLLYLPTNPSAASVLQWKKKNLIVPSPDLSDMCLPFCCPELLKLA